MARETLRTIIRIDEEKCNGCGQCVEACAEGALQLVEGKARLVSESYCDGLGACIGECPQGAISFERRVAEDFDERAVEAHLRRNAGQFQAARGAGRSAGQASALGQWPVQLALVPPTAPYFQGADLLVSANCVPFAYADCHADLLSGKAVVVGCPKLDDAEFYMQKLAAILSASDIRSITVAIMEVPCCRGLERIVRRAVAQAGKKVPIEVVTIGIQGEKLGEARQETHALPGQRP